MSVGLKCLLAATQYKHNKKFCFTYVVIHFAGMCNIKIKDFQTSFLKYTLSGSP